MRVRPRRLSCASEGAASLLQQPENTAGPRCCRLGSRTAMNEASDEGKTRGAWGWRAREPGHGEPGPAALRPASTRWYLAPAAARAVPGSETSPSASPCFQENSSRRLFFYLLHLYSGGVQVNKTAAGLSGQKKAQRFWKVRCYGCWPRSFLVPGRIYSPRYPRSVFFSSTPK